MAATMQVKRGTASALATANPTPAAGEIVWESDTNKLKVGDGTTAYSSLPYISTGGGSGSSYGSQLLFS